MRLRKGMDVSLSVDEALKACIAYASGKSHWDQENEAFVQDIHDGRATDLSFAEQHEMLSLLLGDACDQRTDMMGSFEKERLLSALRDGRVQAWGLPVPHDRHTRKQHIEASQWAYLELNVDHGTAKDASQTYTALEFRVQPDATRAQAASSRTRRRAADRIIQLFEDNFSVLSELTHPARAAEMRMLAEQRDWDTKSGFTSSNIRMVLKRAGYLQNRTP